MRKTFSFILSLILALSLGVQTVCAGDSLEASAENAVLALVQDHEPMSGKFELTNNSHFYIAMQSEPTDELLDTVDLMASQFALAGVPGKDVLGIEYGRSRKAKPGDIVIKLKENIDFSYGGDMADDSEAYSLDISDKATITACGVDGVYYGLLTLLEMAKSVKNEEGVILDGCRIHDGPDVSERTVFLDCGRKYFTKEWIENFIRRSSFQRFNAIQLHFTEAQGIRLDSEVFPWLTKGQKSLSREDMAEIVRTAKRYHMEVIPSIDTPGHNEYMVKKYAAHVKKHPGWSFEYGGKKYSRKNCKGFNKIANHYSYNGETKAADYIGIDITKKHAVAFVDALIDDYAEFFADLGCTKFAIGGDEAFGWYEFTLGGKNFTYSNRWSAFEHWAKYARETLDIKNGSASDAFVNYMNSIAGRLGKMGYTCRMFNDEIYISKKQHVELNENIEIQFWSPAAGNYSRLIDQNRKIYLDIPKWSYYVVRTFDGGDIMKTKYRSVNAENIYNKWAPGKPGIGGQTIPADQLGGEYFNIWCDEASYKSAEKIWKETKYRTWASASRMWNKEINSADSGLGIKLKYEEFKKFAADMGCFPGYTGNPKEAVDLPEVSEPVRILTLWERIFIR